MKKNASTPFFALDFATYISYLISERGKQMTRTRPRDWQLHSTDLTAERVQFWVAGVVVATIALTAAQKLVRENRAFVLSTSAVGALDEDGTTFA